MTNPSVEVKSSILKSGSGLDIVLIDGATVSGKSSLALSFQRASRPCTVLSHDLFLQPRHKRSRLYDDLRTGKITAQQYHDATWHTNALNVAVDTLLAARRRSETVSIEVPRLVDRDPVGVDEIVLTPGELIVIEGVGAFRWKTEPLHTLRVWCEPPSIAVAIERKLNRPRRNAMTDDEVRERYKDAERQHDHWNESIGRPHADVFYISTNEDL